MSGVPSAALGPSFPIVTADWMAARLAGKMLKSERWLVDSSGQVQKTEF